MQSTFSAVSAGHDSLQFDEEEELEAAAAASDTTSEKGTYIHTYYAHNILTHSSTLCVHILLRMYRVYCILHLLIFYSVIESV